ncbi:MAG TPA: glutamine amidotransferase [Cytophagales bacterium]|jgi:transcriptional regulator GlxA family with amidase domain|nr:glutamine amidotransferase [Cytophagales bacterium]
MRNKILYFTLALTISLMGCGRKKNVPEIDKPQRTINVGFVVVDGVYNSELMAPYDIFHHVRFHIDTAMHVFTVAPDSGMVKTFEGISFKADHHFDDPALPDIDVLVLPSAENSMGSDLEDGRLIDFVREKGDEASFVVSLCDGAFVLAEAGLLDSLLVTTFPEDVDKLQSQYPLLELMKKVSFVHDGKAITSAGGALSYEPALYLVEMIYGKEVAKKVGNGLVITWSASLAPYEHGPKAMQYKPIW